MTTTAKNAGKPEAEHAATDVNFIERTEIEHQVAPAGKLGGFLSAMSKSMVASLAGIAGIAVGAGAAVLVKNHMDKKTAEANLAALEHSDAETASM